MQEKVADYVMQLNLSTTATLETQEIGRCGEVGV